MKFGNLYMNMFDDLCTSIVTCIKSMRIKLQIENIYVISGKSYVIFDRISFIMSYFKKV